MKTLDKLVLITGLGLGLIGCSSEQSKNSYKIFNKYINEDYYGTWENGRIVNKENEEKVKEYEILRRQAESNSLEERSK